MQCGDAYGGYMLNGIVEFTPEKRTLVRKDNSMSVVLHAPACGCLLSLIEHHSEVVSQNNLIIAGWGDLHGNVSPNTFYQAILGLRQCLEDVGLNKDFIITVRRRGLLIPASNFILPLETPETTLPFNISTEQSAPLLSHSNNNDTHKKNHLFSYKKTLFTLLLLMTIIFCYFLIKKTLQQNSIEQTEYFSNYYELQKFKNCHIFANNPMLNYDTYVYFIKEKNLACDQREWWYISADINSPRISVVRCINNIIKSSKNYCSTDYYYGSK